MVGPRLFYEAADLVLGSKAAAISVIREGLGP